jgi:hypothetical protein
LHTFSWCACYIRPWATLQHTLASPFPDLRVPPFLNLRVPPVSNLRAASGSGLKYKGVPMVQTPATSTLVLSSDPACTVPGGDTMGFPPAKSPSERRRCLAVSICLLHAITGLQDALRFLHVIYSILFWSRAEIPERPNEQTCLTIVAPPAQSPRCRHMPPPLPARSSDRRLRPRAWLPELSLQLAVAALHGSDDGCLDCRRTQRRRRRRRRRAPGPHRE